MRMTRVAEGMALPAGSPNADVRILADPEELSRTAAEEFVRRTDEAVRAGGTAAVALAGGSTPRALYRLLAGEGAPMLPGRIPWGQIHFFWGDERHVPTDHPESNYRMAHEAMLSRVPVPPGNIHRIQGEIPDAASAAREYARTLREVFRLASGQLPRFDLILLGMGPDGHTASLFPGTDAALEREKLVAAPWVEKLRGYRITLTPPVLNHAACVMFLVSGEEKAETVRAVLQGDYQQERLPAQLIRPRQGRLLWMLDRASARLLPARGRAAG